MKSAFSPELISEKIFKTTLREQKKKGITKNKKLQKADKLYRKSDTK